MCCSLIRDPPSSTPFYSSAASDVYKRQAKNPGILSPDVDLRLNKPELRVEVDRVKAAELGVSIDVVARTIETMLGGRVVTRYKRYA